jgi:hypothetical protein
MKRILSKSRIASSRLVLGGLLVLGALPRLGWAQCNCTQTIATNPAYRAVITVSGGTLCINSGVTVQNATIRVTGNNVTICNQGTIGDNYSGNGYGVIEVESGVRGLVINNTGTVNTQTMQLRPAVTLNNGSSDGGATVAPGATWQGYLANTFGAAPVITNYAAWQAQLSALPGGTITNVRKAVWSGYLTTSADLSITNAGVWTSQVQEAGGNPTISIVHSGRDWSGVVGGGAGALRITNNGTWAVPFNFPSGSDNAFTNAAGASTSFSGYWGLAGQVAIINNGSMSLGDMAPLGSTSSLTMAANSTLSLTGDLTNQGTVLNQGTISSANFTNGGTITGANGQRRGQFRASGYTVNNGRFGADGSNLDFCDSTPPTAAGQGFDARGGTIGRNVTYCTSSTPTTIAGTPLPVTLVSFTVQPGQGQALLQWATASERNNDKFVVERSADGLTFTALQAVAGHGTTALGQAYSYRDAQPLPGLSYYRLRQVDLDGTSTYSPVLSSRQATAATVLLFPNPTAGRLTLDLRTLPAGPCEVRVLGTLGQLLLTETRTSGQLQALALDQLPAGTYLVQLRAAGYHQVQRVVKQ